MQLAEQQERIRAMLIRYRDCLSAQKLGNAGADGRDSRQLLFPREFNDAMRELDRCLTLMRKNGNQQAIHGIPLRTVRFHVVAWYIDVDYRQVPMVRILVGKKGQRHKMPNGYRLEPRRHPDAREQKAELGVQWLAGEYRWDQIHLKAINEACGELLAA